MYWSEFKIEISVINMF